MPLFGRESLNCDLIYHALEALGVEAVLEIASQRMLTGEEIDPELWNVIDGKSNYAIIYVTSNESFAHYNLAFVRGSDQISLARDRDR